MLEEMVDSSCRRRRDKDERVWQLEGHMQCLMRAVFGGRH